MWLNTSSPGNERVQVENRCARTLVVAEKTPSGNRVGDGDDARGNESRLQPVSVHQDSMPLQSRSPRCRCRYRWVALSSGRAAKAARMVSSVADRSRRSRSLSRWQYLRAWRVPGVEILPAAA